MLKKLIKVYLDQQKLMQIATVKDGKPWVCSVWQVSDQDLNIYYFSSITRRHSIEIESNPNISGALCYPSTPEEAPRGLSFEGTVERLVSTGDIAVARSLYEGRIFPPEKVDEFMAHKERAHSFYKITPTSYVLFDVESYPDNPRQQLDL